MSTLDDLFIKHDSEHLRECDDDIVARDIDEAALRWEASQMAARDSYPASRPVKGLVAVAVLIPLTLLVSLLGVPTGWVVTLSVAYLAVAALAVLAISYRRSLAEQFLEVLTYLHQTGGWDAVSVAVLATRTMPRRSLRAQDLDFPGTYAGGVVRMTCSTNNQHLVTAEAFRTLARRLGVDRATTVMLSADIGAELDIVRLLVAAHSVPDLDYQLMSRSFRRPHITGPRPDHGAWLEGCREDYIAAVVRAMREQLGPVEMMRVLADLGDHFTTRPSPMSPNELVEGFWAKSFNHFRP